MKNSMIALQVLAACLVAATVLPVFAAKPKTTTKDPAVLEMQSAKIQLEYVKIESLREAIEDLMKTFPEEYPDGAAYLAQLKQVGATAAKAKALIDRGDRAGLAEAEKVFAFQRKALLSNPLLKSDGICVVRHGPGPYKKNGKVMPLRRLLTGYYHGPSHGGTSWDADLVILSIDGGGKVSMRSLFKPKDGLALGHLDVHWDGKTLLYSHGGKLEEIGIDGSGRREVITPEANRLDNFMGCYLPDGSVIFSSHAGNKAIPCAGGQSTQLFRLESDRRSIRRVTFDQDHDYLPRVMDDGRVMFLRWDYTDAHHYYARIVMGMNPDGSGQVGLFGSNEYAATGRHFATPIIWHPTKFVMINMPYGNLGGIQPFADMLIIDRARGNGAAGVEHVMLQRGKPFEPSLVEGRLRKDMATFDIPRFTTPRPLAAADPRGSGKYFLAGCKLNEDLPTAICLVDIFDNLTIIHEDMAESFIEPVLLRQRFKPPVIPDRRIPDKDTANVYVQDVYFGPGLAGVPRGTVKAIRVYAYHFNYDAFPAQQYSVGINSGWDCRRILGTAAVHEDGSAYFEIPANTPVAFQPLDTEGQALQVMRNGVVNSRNSEHQDGQQQANCAPWEL